MRYEKVALKRDKYYTWEFNHSLVIIHNSDLYPIAYYKTMYPDKWFEPALRSALKEVVLSFNMWTVMSKLYWLVEHTLTHTLPSKFCLHLSEQTLRSLGIVNKHRSGWLFEVFTSWPRGRVAANNRGCGCGCGCGRCQSRAKFYLWPRSKNFEIDTPNICW